MSVSIEVGRLRVEAPGDFRPMTAEEATRHFLARGAENAWKSDDPKAILRVDEAKYGNREGDVEERLGEYRALYARMAAGFEAGEAVAKDVPGGSVGVLTFKTNAPTCDLYNALAIAQEQDGGESYEISLTCDLNDAAQLAPQWSKALSEVAFAASGVETCEAGGA